MEQATTIGLDIAKHVFQVHGADAAGHVLFRKRITRGKLHQIVCESRIFDVGVLALARGSRPKTRGWRMGPY